MFCLLQVHDLVAARSVEQAGRRGELGGARRWPRAYFSGKKKEESQLAKIARDSTKITMEQIQGLMTQAKPACVLFFVPSHAFSRSSKTPSSTASSPKPTEWPMPTQSLHINKDKMD